MTTKIKDTYDYVFLNSFLRPLLQQIKAYG